VLRMAVDDEECATVAGAAHECRSRPVLSRRRLRNENVRRTRSAGRTISTDRSCEPREQLVDLPSDGDHPSAGSCRALRWLPRARRAHRPSRTIGNIK
jgi:hypothetical protein